MFLLQVAICFILNQLIGISFSMLARFSTLSTLNKVDANALKEEKNSKQNHM